MGKWQQLLRQEHGGQPKNLLRQRARENRSAAPLSQQQQQAGRQAGRPSVPPGRIAGLRRPDAGGQMLGRRCHGLADGGADSRRASVPPDEQSRAVKCVQYIPNSHTSQARYGRVLLPGSLGRVSTAREPGRGGPSAGQREGPARQSWQWTKATSHPCVPRAGPVPAWQGFVRSRLCVESVRDQGPGPRKPREDIQVPPVNRAMSQSRMCSRGADGGRFDDARQRISAALFCCCCCCCCLQWMEWCRIEETQPIEKLRPPGTNERSFTLLS